MDIELIRTATSFTRRPDTGGVGEGERCRQYWNPLSNGRLASGLADVPELSEGRAHRRYGPEWLRPAESLANPFETCAWGFTTFA